MIDFVRLKKQFQEYLDLNYVKSLNDTDEEPYKTKYEARNFLEITLKQFKSDYSSEALVNSEECLKRSYFQDSTDIIHSQYIKHLINLDPICNKLFSISSVCFLVTKLLEFNLAKNLIETEEVEQGEKIIKAILNELEKVKIDENEYNPLIFNFKLCCFNEIIYVWSSRSYYNECLTLLQSIEEMYNIYKYESKKVSNNDQSAYTMPFLPIELITIDPDYSQKRREKSFESLYTHSLFYFAQIYGKLGDKQKSAFYVQLTLQRQMDEHNEESNLKLDEFDEKINASEEKVQFEPLDWATHAAALSQYYLCEEDFPTAKHVSKVFIIFKCIR
jgi:hypothetical protein